MIVNKKRIGKWKGKKEEPPLFDQRSFEYARDLRVALDQTEGIPVRDRWSMAMALLSDELLEAMTKPAPSAGDLLDFFAPMILVMTLDWLGEEPNGDTAPMALFALRCSFVTELEKRRKLFTTDAIHMQHPFYYHPDHPVEFVPRDPETFDEGVLFRHYFGIIQPTEEAERAEAEAVAAAERGGPVRVDAAELVGAGVDSAATPVEV